MAAGEDSSLDRRMRLRSVVFARRDIHLKRRYRSFAKAVVFAVGVGVGVGVVGLGDDAFGAGVSVVGSEGIVVVPKGCVSPSVDMMASFSDENGAKGKELQKTRFRNGVVACASRVVGAARL